MTSRDVKASYDRIIGRRPTRLPPRAPLMSSAVETPDPYTSLRLVAVGSFLNPSPPPFG
jgi:hypothetical protein